jgi:hypothetical protein
MVAEAAVAAIGGKEATAEIHRNPFVAIVLYMHFSVCRLWDAVGGFLFLFSHMQDKLSKHSSQVDLLKELLNLQKDMITMMLSMLEGNNACYRNMTT